MNQLDLYKIFKDFRVSREDATYPPYHEGKYLEEYFVDKFEQADTENNKRLLIPVYWTAVFNYKASDGLGPETENYRLRQKLFNIISDLPKDAKYFTVSTHDDAPQGNFPTDTKHFYAGGNSSIGTDPIPLICSSFKNVSDPQKLCFASFVGSATNPIRNHALQALSKKEGYAIQGYHWRPDVTADQQKLFIDLTSRSRFTICPRGYGATSYRMYEAMQLGSIPVYISDKHMLPWRDELSWTKLAVVAHPSEDYSELDNHLKAMTETEVRKMQQEIKDKYEMYFSIPGVYNQILRRLA